MVNSKYLLAILHLKPYQMQGIINHYNAKHAGKNLVNEQDEYGKTLSHYIAERGLTYKYNKAVQYILFANNPNFDIQDREGQTPLHIIAYYSENRVIASAFPEFINYGIRNKANLSLLNKEGRSVLHLTAMGSYKHSNQIKTILDIAFKYQYKIDIDQLSSSGSTALFYAINWLRIDEAKYLLQQKANPLCGAPDRQPLKIIDELIKDIEDELNKLAAEQSQEAVSAEMISKKKHSAETSLIAVKELKELMLNAVRKSARIETTKDNLCVVLTPEKNDASNQPDENEQTQKHLNVSNNLYCSFATTKYNQYIYQQAKIKKTYSSGLGAQTFGTVCTIIGAVSCLIMPPAGMILLLLGSLINILASLLLIRANIANNKINKDPEIHALLEARKISEDKQHIAKNQLENINSIYAVAASTLFSIATSSANTGALLIVSALTSMLNPLTAAIKAIELAARGVVAISTLTTVGTTFFNIDSKMNFDYAQKFSDSSYCQWQLHA
jgi:hypothetical protein